MQESKSWLGFHLSKLWLANHVLEQATSAYKAWEQQPLHTHPLFLAVQIHQQLFELLIIAPCCPMLCLQLFYLDDSLDTADTKEHVITRGGVGVGGWH